MNLKWIEPESRFLVKLVFKKNFDTFTESAQRNTNWGVLALDIVLLWVLL